VFSGSPATACPLSAPVGEGGCSGRASLVIVVAGSTVAISPVAAAMVATRWVVGAVVWSVVDAASVGPVVMVLLAGAVCVGRIRVRAALAFVTRVCVRVCVVVSLPA
jgi:hypothetical protein